MSIIAKTQLKCPACDKLHEIFVLFVNVRVMICPIIPDLVYVGVIAKKEVRKMVRESLFGSENEF